LLVEQTAESRTSYAYDAANRLIAAQRVAGETVQPVTQQASKPTSLWRYHHDANGNRLIAQEGDRTQRIDHAKASNRSGEVDAAGQTTKLDGKRLEWDAIGRLESVKGPDFEASYAYSHRGERIGKTVLREGTEDTTGYLYDDAGRIATELNASGRITRLYVHMADLPLAVIDGEAELAQADQDGWQRIASDLKRAWRARDQAVAFLHLNHLHAPEAATDQDGLVIWTASYAPYGRATPSRSPSPSSFKLHLRLPGQYEDEETGLHDNRHRTYDPDQGRYLSADPLGLKGGTNGFVYVDGNPLRYVDPDGLVLFAFDGTNNTNDEEWLRRNGSSATNVWQFRELYQSGNRRYVAGVGTVHRDAQYGDIEPPWRDDAFNFTGRQRIDRMVQYFDEEATAANDDEVMEIDIVGFSRGASQARDFANQIVANTRNGCYSYTDRNGVQHHQRVRFRFMGLFDTVLSTNLAGRYNLAIPDEFASVAHATAVNEFRGNLRHPMGSYGAFPLESISPTTSSEGSTRIERGFLGAHADIGGGFGADESQLAQVALAWMVQQARTAGVTMNSPPSTVAAHPVVHDRSNSIRTGAPAAGVEDRTVRFADGTRTTQRNSLPVEGMSYLDSREFIDYFPRDDPARQRFQTGTVAMREYLAWLRQHGYDLGDMQAEGEP
jgi:RHS repeat-associated protein